jgi:hypothetical protein
VDRYYEVPYDPGESAEPEVSLSQDVTPTEKKKTLKKCKVKCEPGKTPRAHVYETEGAWLVVPPSAFAGIEDPDDRYRALFSVGKAVTRAIPLLHYSGPDDLSFTPFANHIAANDFSALFIYERTRGGVGLAQRTFERIKEILDNALYEVIEGCKRCQEEPGSAGCPSCIADISGMHDRALAVRLLRSWLGQPMDPASPEAAMQAVGFTEPEEIGEGGMGKVYKARRDDQWWALKMAGDGRESPQDCTEIAQEGLRQKRLASDHAWGQHPNILPVFDVITIDPFVFLQLEYADGGSLHERIGPLGYTPHGARGPIEKALGSVRDILPVIDAVAHMHECGWVHRDIKPANILFVGSTPKLSDLGIARRQATDDEKTAGAGTPGWAAPGQIATEVAPDYRDDVYSLGVVLIAMLTGRRPNAGQPLAGLPSRIPAPLQAIVKKATATAKNRRYDTARAMHQELERLLEL